MRELINDCGSAIPNVSAMRNFNGTFVTIKRPPRCVTIRMRPSPDVFLLTDATSKLGRRSNA